MKTRTNIKYLCGFLLFSAALGYLLVYLTGLGNLFYYFLSFLLSGLLFSVVLLLYNQLTAISNKSRYDSELTRTLQLLLHFKASGLPILSSLDKAAEYAKLPSLKRSLSNMSRRIKLGEISANRPLEISDTSKIKSMISLHELRLQEKVSIVESHSQSSATITMFLSTILPSFVVFAFIGTTIISNSLPNMLLFSIAMLLILPMAYAVSHAQLSRRVLE